MQILIDTLITADVIVTQNATREILYDAAIGITDGRITFLESIKKGRLPQATKVIHLGKSIVMPGLINAHTHSAMGIMRGLADDLPLMQWLTNHIFPVEQHLQEDIVYLGSLLGIAEMIQSGTTAFADMYMLSEGVCKAANTAGIKCLAGEVIFSFPSPACQNADKALELVEQQAENWCGHENIRIGVMPHAVYTTTPAILQKCQKLAQKHNLPLHIHLAETKEETSICLQNFQQRPVQYMQNLGLLDSQTTIAHAVDLNEQEIALLAKNAVKIAHCPKSNLKLASGVAPAPKMLEHGLNIGIGTDGAASNNSLNMFSELNMCALLHKGLNQDPTLLPAQQVLDMATLAGAEALGWQGLGCLQLGSKADLIGINLNNPSMQPLYNPISQLVYACTGHELCLSMVNGKTLYQNSEFKTIDLPNLFKEISKIKRWVLEKSGRN